MTTGQLIAEIKLLYGSDIPYTDEEISAFLTMAENEIIRWEYSLVDTPESVDTSKYDSVKEMAVLVGLTQHGAEGQTLQSEGSFNRSFSKPTMLEYIHSHVIPYAGMGR